MEHLFVKLEDIVIATETTNASSASVLEDVTNRKEGLIPPVSPFPEWLGFDHDENSFPVQSDLTMYPLIRGWDVSSMWDNGDLRQGHDNLQDDHVDPVSVGRQGQS
jgi:hypothetical protein